MDWQAIAALIGAAVIAIGGIYRAYREIERRAYAQAQLDLTAKSAEQTIARKDRELNEVHALNAELKAERGELKAEITRLRGIVSTLMSRLDSP